LTARTEKVSITVPPHTVQAARMAVEQNRADSVSAYFAAAADQTERLLSLSGLLAQMTAEHGPPTPDDYLWADTVLGLR
jgi:hypothetical protein